MIKGQDRRDKTTITNFKHLKRAKDKPNRSTPMPSSWAPSNTSTPLTWSGQSPPIPMTGSCARIWRRVQCMERWQGSPTSLWGILTALLPWFPSQLWENQTEYKNPTEHGNDCSLKLANPHSLMIYKLTEHGRIKFDFISWIVLLSYYFHHQCINFLYFR